MSHSLNHKASHYPHWPLTSPHPNIYTLANTKMLCCTQADIHHSLRVLSVTTDRAVVCLYSFVLLHISAFMLNKRSHCPWKFALSGINRHCLLCVPRIRLTFFAILFTQMTYHSVKLIVKTKWWLDNNGVDNTVVSTFHLQANCRGFIWQRPVNLHLQFNLEAWQTKIKSVKWMLKPIILFYLICFPPLL